MPGTLKARNFNLIFSVCTRAGTFFKFLYADKQVLAQIKLTLLKSHRWPTWDLNLETLAPDS